MISIYKEVWQPLAGPLEELDREAEAISNLADEFSLNTRPMSMASLDFAAAMTEGRIEDAQSNSAEFAAIAESTSEDLAILAGTIQRFTVAWNNLSVLIQETTTLPPGSLGWLLGDTREPGSQEETFVSMGEDDRSGELVISMLQDLNAGRGVKLPNMDQNLREFKDLVLELADYHHAAAYTALEDQVGMNIYELGLSSRPAAKDDEVRIQELKAHLLDAAEERDWKEIQSAAGEEAEYAKSLALATNNFTFVDLYAIAYKAKLIADIALNGDLAWAEEVLPAHLPFLRDDSNLGMVYTGGCTLLPPLEGSLTGVVHDARGRPVPNVPLRIIDPNTSTVVGEVQSDACGRYAVNVLPGNFTLESTVPGYASTSMSTGVEGEEAVEKNINTTRQQVPATSGPSGASHSSESAMPQPSEAPVTGRHRPNDSLNFGNTSQRQRSLYQGDISPIRSGFRITAAGLAMMKAGESAGKLASAMRKMASGLRDISEALKTLD